MLTQTQQTHCQILDWGIIDYKKAWQQQRQVVDDVIAQRSVQSLIFCQHPTVITLGRSSHAQNILFPKEDITKRGIDIVEIDRGGDITLHAPGQLVVYPILNLTYQRRDLHHYLHALEHVGIDLLNDFQIISDRIIGKTGVYVSGKKIMSIGVGVKKWISYHGIGLNVNTDLSLFSLIKPCGLDVKMTSISDIKNQSIDIADVKSKLIKHFIRIFNLKLIN